MKKIMSATNPCRSALDSARILATCAALLVAAAVPVMAQTAASTPAQSPSDQDQVVQMSSFIVRTTQGQGYVSTNSAAGLKGNQRLLDIPQSLLVITSDLINDAK
jgi:outer membrane receptor for ferric coprogen and ferric-rhodotorulic acid